MYTATFDGRTYLFAGEKQKQMFLVNPNKYLPALGGDCVVTYASTGNRKPGKVRYGAYHGGRLFFFASQEQKDVFKANLRKFEDVDLALSGTCPVCHVETRGDVAGKEALAVQSQGLRYLFATAEHQTMFVANPAKYKPRTSETQLLDAGCANCLFEMDGIEDCRLAVKIGGKPYLVEGVQADAHNLGLCETVKKVTVSGKIEGNRFLANKFAMER